MSATQERLIDLGLPEGDGTAGSRPRRTAGVDDATVDSLFDELRHAFRRSRQVGVEHVAELAERINVLERDLAEMEKLLVASEQQAARLANLYVAAYQLHASLDPTEVRGAVAEIAVNLLGAQSCLLLLALDRERPGHEVVNLVPEVAPGAPFDGHRYGGGDCLVDASLEDGVVRFGPDVGSRAVAVVPLVVQGNVLGALVLLSLLPHKATLHDGDRELLDLLGAHAASAILVSLLRRNP